MAATRNYKRHNSSDPDGVSYNPNQRSKDDENRNFMCDLQICAAQINTLQTVQHFFL
jgi:hypothetical protein